jgi:hypothetical protein
MYHSRFNILKIEQLNIVKWVQWLMPAISSTPEVEMDRIVVGDHLKQKVSKTICQQIN